MKKTNTMRVAVLLLALALVTSCFVGGTFAKYVAKATGEDNARVAYWGFKDTTIEINDLFEYSDTGVFDTNVEGLIAPGTSNEVKFSFAWTKSSMTDMEGVAEDLAAPEVDYTFDVVVTGDCAQAIEDNTNIKWYLDGAEYATFAALKTAIDDLADGSVVEAGTLPANFAEGQTHTVGWMWDFEEAENNETPESELDAQDIIDTNMGNNATALEVNLAITVTAVQVDGTEATTPDNVVA